MTLKWGVSIVGISVFAVRASCLVKLSYQSAKGFQALDNHINELLCGEICVLYTPDCQRC